MAEPSNNPPGPPHAARMSTPLAGDKIDAHVACAIPFHPYCGGVIARNVSEYMLVLAVCLVSNCDYTLSASRFISM